MNIEAWTVGCVFSNRKGHLLEVEEMPNDGTCSSKVAQVWYGNNEISAYLKQKAWMPWSGCFGIVPTIGLLNGQDPSTQEVYGYWNRQGDRLYPYN